MEDRILYGELRKINNNMRAISQSTIYGTENLSHSQINILSIIKDNKNIMQKEIAHKLGIKPSSITEALVKLEERGFIKRVKDEKDLRITRVYVTKNGVLELESINDTRNSQEKEIFKVLNNEEKESLFILLKKINDDLSGGK